MRGRLSSSGRQTTTSSVFGTPRSGRATTDGGMCAATSDAGTRMTPSPLATHSIVSSIVCTTCVPRPSLPIRAEDRERRHCGGASRMISSRRSSGPSSGRAASGCVAGIARTVCSRASTAWPRLAAVRQPSGHHSSPMSARRASTPAHVSDQSARRSATLASGCSFAKLASAAGSSPLPGESQNPIVSPAAAALTATCASEAVSRMRRAKGSSASPAEVSRTPSCSRWNSGALRVRSSAATCLLSVGWETNSSCAARVKFRCSATARKYLRSRRCHIA
jgi:hypothetical protein